MGVRLPYPDEVPPGLRAAIRALTPPPVKRAGVWSLWRLAQLTDTFDPAYRANRARVEALRNTRKGETCVVIGNGPSLKHTDFGLVAKVPSFGLNRINLLAAETGFVPTYHVAVNDILIEQFGSELAAVPSQLFIPWRHRSAFTGRDKNICFFTLQLDDRFSTNARDGVAAGGTVTMVALQLAYHFGFSRVLLVGVDHRYVHEGTKNQELTATAPDPNHFSQGYFGPGIRWNAPDLERSEISYREAKAVYEADSRRIIDCTVDGALTIFDKSTLARELG